MTTLRKPAGVQHRFGKRTSVQFRSLARALLNLLSFMLTGVICALLGYTVAINETRADAYKLARQDIEQVMRVACSSWFTDTRAKTMPRQIVVCRLPNWTGQ